MGRRWWLASLMVSLAPLACSQSDDFLPEMEVFFKVHPATRFEFQAKEMRENGVPVQAEIGPSINFYWRPLKNLIPKPVDEARTRFILLSLGYRYLPQSSAPATNRILLVATPRFPMTARAKPVISDRNRGEINFTKGTVDWRFRNPGCNWNARSGSTPIGRRRTPTSRSSTTASLQNGAAL